MKAAFVIHKPKARKIAERAKLGFEARGIPFREIYPNQEPERDEVCLFYGTSPQTFPTFLRCVKEGRALYLDNGFLNGRGETTLRWAWNGQQAHPSSLRKSPEDLPRLGWSRKVKPQSITKNRATRALIVLQSPEYLRNFHIETTQNEWLNGICNRLREKGWDFDVRRKPTKENPAPEPVEDAFKRYGLVVSLNSAATVKALAVGVPAYCDLNCTMKAVTLPGIPYAGSAVVPDHSKVERMLAKLAWADFTYGDLVSGKAIMRMMKTPTDQRKGIVYAPT